MTNLNSADPFNVVIAGGGVAAVEGALALRDLGGDRIATTILAPNADLVYRPATVREPFGYSLARRYPLEQLTRDIGIRLWPDKLDWLDGEHSVVHTESGQRIGYDALLLAIGAKPYSRYKHSITIDDSRLDEQLHGLIQDLEGGYLHKLAFIIPTGAAWPLPIYELALMMAARAQEMCTDVSITLVTPEDAPLAIFGERVSDQVQRLLADSGILTITSTHSEVPEHGRVTLSPGGRDLSVDRVIALPELLGPSVGGIPRGSRGGFLPIDALGKVRGLERVYAAGDATDFPIKHGGVAAQQADTAARAIAALAGLAPEPRPARTELHALLLTGGKPVYLSGTVSGRHGNNSEISLDASWTPLGKVAAKYLGPYLEKFDRVGSGAR